MTGKTHITAGLVASLALNTNAPQVALIAIGSMLPDLDHAGSTFGKKIKPISRHIEHRGITHSLIFLIITILISPYLGLGVLTHMALDLLNPNGIKLLYPLKYKFKVPFISTYIKTGGAVEHVLFILMVAFGLVLIFLNNELWGGYQNIWGLAMLFKQ